MHNIWNTVPVGYVAIDIKWNVAVFLVDLILKLWFLCVFADTQCCCWYDSCFIIEQVWINLGDIILLGLRDYQVQYP